MTAFTAIDLSTLPAPQVIRPLDFEAILAARKADLSARSPELAAALLLESEPATKIEETGAYYETLHYARVNDAARAVMLPYASSTDLDQLGALFGVARLVITPADDSTDPVTPAVMESDERYRYRISLAPEAYNTAGSRGAYIYHAMTAAPSLKHVGATRTAPGRVQVALLDSTADGAVSDEVLTAVRVRLTADDVQPLTDEVTVIGAGVLHYQIKALLRIPRGPDPAYLITQARAALQRLADERHQLGAEVHLSALFGACHVPNVIEAVILSPAATLLASDTQAYYCDQITLTTEVLHV